MAVLELDSTQMDGETRKRPLDDHGKMRIQYFTIPAVEVAGDAGTTLRLCELPPGAVRVLPGLSRISTSAFGVARTLNVGHAAYSTRPPDEADEAEDPDAFIAAMDVSAAVNGAAFGTGLSYDIYSRAGVEVFATVAGGTIPVGATVEGFVTYIYE